MRDTSRPGRPRFEFERDLLHQFEELFRRERSEDPEIVAFAGRGSSSSAGRLGRETAPRPSATSERRSVAKARRWQPPCGARAHHPTPGGRE